MGILGREKIPVLLLPMVGIKWHSICLTVGFGFCEKDNCCGLWARNTSLARLLWCGDLGKYYNKRLYGGLWGTKLIFLISWEFLLGKTVHPSLMVLAFGITTSASSAHGGIGE